MQSAGKAKCGKEKAGSGVRCPLEVPAYFRW